MADRSATQYQQDETLDTANQAVAVQCNQLKKAPAMPSPAPSTLTTMSDALVAEASVPQSRR